MQAELHPRRRRRAEAGFTLVEVMVALLLTVVAVIGIVALYMVETRASGFSRHENEASVLAEDKMEVLRTIAPPAGPTAGTDANINEEEGPGGIYTRTWSIGPDGNGVQVLVVQVTWNEDGITRTVTENGRY